MSKEEFIEFVINNNYRYFETPNEINIDRITNKLENTQSCITYDKWEHKVMLWLEENGSGLAHELNSFELECINYFYEMEVKK